MVNQNEYKEILGTKEDDGKHFIKKGDYPEPNIMLMIDCAESIGGAATYGTDGKWYWTYDYKISEPCEYTVISWRYL